MPLGVGLRNLATLVDTLEQEGAAVTAADVDEVQSEETITVSLQLEIPCAESLDDQTPDVTQEHAPSSRGTGPLAVSKADEQSENSASGADPDSPDAAPEQVEDSGEAESVACTNPNCEATFDTERGMKIHRAHVHGLSETAQPEHHDPDALREVYTEYDTFQEMADALDSDVTAATVRRQLIEHDIHDVQPHDGTNKQPRIDGTPDVNADGDHRRVVETDGAGTVTDDFDALASIADSGNADAADADDTADSDEADADTEADADDEADVSDVAEADVSAEPDADADLVTDSEVLSDLSLDVDLPDGLSPADIYDAVKDARTMYEVQRRLDLDDDEARSLLSELDLLDLVYGRLATATHRERAKEEIGERLLRHAEDTTASA